MGERLTMWIKLIKLRATALGQDHVTGVAVIGLDGLFAVGGFVLAVVAAETAGPVPVADVIGINLPVGLHFGEKVLAVNVLHFVDRQPHARVVGILRGQFGGDLLQSFGLVA